MGNLVLKIKRTEKKAQEANYVYKDIDAFSDKYAVNKVDLVVDVEAVKASVRNIFMWNVGEEILFPQFGNALKRFLYNPLDDTSRTELAQEVRRCIEENEPRVVIDGLGVERSDEDDAAHSTIRLLLNYHVKGAPSTGAAVSDTITITGGTNGPVNKEAT